MSPLLAHSFGIPGPLSFIVDKDTFLGFVLSLAAVLLQKAVNISNEYATLQGVLKHLYERPIAREHYGTLAFMPLLKVIVVNELQPEKRFACARYSGHENKMALDSITCLQGNLIELGKARDENGR